MTYRMLLSRTHLVGCSSKQNMNKAIIGIDPGVTGGIAYIKPDAVSVEFKELVLDTLPAVLRGLITIRAYANIPSIAYVEKQWIWKNERDFKTANTLIKNFGYVLGVLRSLNIPYHEVAPRTWKREVLGNGNATKEQARMFVKETYGIELKVTQDGLYDALCIAHYGFLHEMI